jgi:hypothetical protein
MTAEEFRTERARHVAGRATSLLGALALFAMPLVAPARGAPLDAESQACQGCHAILDWEINDPVTGRVAHLSIEPEAYARSSHGSVPCRSCHSWGYGEIPHRGSSEHPIYECVFCHDKDPGVQLLRLSQRKADLRHSVHGNTEAGPLDCHTCHDPHTFQLVNDSDDPLLRIERSNAICLRCHGPETDPRGRFGQEDAAPYHAAFPNYANHLRKVKCVVCHTARADDAAGTRHEILASDLALRECEQCHTPSSAILDAIYGPQHLGDGVGLAGLPGPGVEVVGDAYVMGSTRSPRLERLSVVGFAATCLAIVLHGLARAVYALRRRGSNDV